MESWNYKREKFRISFLLNLFDFNILLLNILVLIHLEQFKYDLHNIVKKIDFVVQ